MGYYTAVLNGSEVRTICDWAFGPGFGRGAVQTWGSILSRWNPRPPPNLHHKFRRAGLQNITCFQLAGAFSDTRWRSILASKTRKASPSGIAVSWHGTGGPLWRTRFSAGDAGTYRCLWIYISLSHAEVGSSKYWWRLSWQALFLQIS